MSDRVGVIVGLNGAGKSAILEDLKAISSVAIGRFRRIRQNDEDSIPKILDISILTPHNRKLEYGYELLPALDPTEDSDIDNPDNGNSEEDLYFWNEQCKYIDEEEEIIWTTDRILLRSRNAQINLPDSRNAKFGNMLKSLSFVYETA
ncbi:MAG: hypothetical protein AAFO76_08785 [Cyanobacteria bacterium J06607_15]